MVEAARPGPKAEPVARELIATLTHPDRKATIRTLKFSEDGKRLFAAGFPSGTVQVFDVESRRELRRIDTPPSRRTSYIYTALTPDWKTMYVPIEVRKVASTQKDGKSVPRVEYSGRIGVWDLTTGAERPDLRPPVGSGAAYLAMSPDGRHALSLERGSFTAGEKQPAGVWALNLQTGERRKLFDGDDYPRFSPNGKIVLVTSIDSVTKTYIMKLLDFATGKELAHFPCPRKGAMMFGGEFSPEGELIYVDIRGPKGERPTILFLDTKTFEERGRFEGEPDPTGLGLIATAFSPDGKHSVLVEMTGKTHVWDLAKQKVVRSFEFDSQNWGTFSPDGKTWAVVWAPRDPGQERRNSDPGDLPQPRITLFDLAGTNPPRTLIAPHGFVGALTFSPDNKTLAFGTSGGIRIFDLTK